MRGRPAEPRSDWSPGPGEYAPSPGGERGPAYTMRGRAEEGPAGDAPGPGDYHRNSTALGPAYTMAGRHQELTVLGDDVIIDPDIPGVLSPRCSHTCMPHPKCGTHVSKAL
eukprot:210076-Chlamydomonas_euryale.AAC.1